MGTMQASQARRRASAAEIRPPASSTADLRPSIRSVSFIVSTRWGRWPPRLGRSPSSSHQIQCEPVARGFVLAARKVQGHRVKVTKQPFTDVGQLRRACLLHQLHGLRISRGRDPPMIDVITRSCPGPMAPAASSVAVAGNPRTSITRQRPARHEQACLLHASLPQLVQPMNTGFRGIFEQHGHGLIAATGTDNLSASAPPPGPHRRGRPGRIAPSVARRGSSPAGVASACAGAARRAPP